MYHICFFQVIGKLLEIVVIVELVVFLIVVVLVVAVEVVVFIGVVVPIVIVAVCWNWQVCSRSCYSSRSNSSRSNSIHISSSGSSR